MKQILFNTGYTLGTLVLITVMGMLVKDILLNTNAILSVDGTKVLSNTGCYDWRDPCIRDRKWINKCALSPRINRAVCTDTECNHGENCPSYDPSATFLDAVVKEKKRGPTRRSRPDARQVNNIVDPMLQSGCYFWYDPCAKGTAVCAPPPRVIHVACDDIKCNMGKCKKLEEKPKKEEVKKNVTSADSVTIELHDFNGDGKVNSKDKRILAEIEKDISDERTVTSSTRDGKRADRISARERFSKGCFNQKGEWTIDLSDCAEDQSQFVWKAYSIEKAGILDDLGQGDDTEWEERIEDTVFQGKDSERRVEFLGVAGKMLHRFALLQDRDDLSVTFQAQLSSVLQEMSSLYDSVLDAEDLSDEDLGTITHTVRKEVAIVETLLTSDEQTRQYEKAQKKIMETIAMVDEEEGDEDEDAAREEEAAIHGAPSVSTSPPYPSAFVPDIKEILEDTQKLFDKIPTVLAVYKEENIAIPPQAIVAYNKGKALYEKIKPACQDNIETCPNLWEVFTFIEAMQRPMVSALYSSGNDAAIKRIEEMFRDMEGEHRGPMPEDICHKIVGDTSIQDAMREECDEMYREREKERVYYVPPGEIPDNIYNEHTGEGEEGVPWFWTMDGKSYQIPSPEKCKEIGDAEGWTEEEKEWCVRMFQYEEDGYMFTYGDDYGVRVKSAAECESYHEQYTWTETELELCIDLFSYESSSAGSQASESSHSSEGSEGSYSSWGTESSYSYSYSSDDEYFDIEFNTRADCDSQAAKDNWGSSDLEWCYDWVDGGGDSNNTYVEDGFMFTYGNNYGVRVKSVSDCEGYDAQYYWTDAELTSCKALFNEDLGGGGGGNSESSYSTISSAISSVNSSTSSTDGTTFYEFYTSDGSLFHVESASRCTEFAATYNWDESNKLWCLGIFNGGSSSSYGSTYGGTSGGTSGDSSSSYSYTSGGDSSSSSGGSSGGCFYSGVLKDGSDIGYTVHCTSSGTDCRYGSSGGDLIDMTGVVLGSNKSCY